MTRYRQKFFSWTVLTGLIFNLLSPLFLLPWQQVLACFGSWDCGGNAYCAGAGSYPDHPGSCASYGERGNNDRTTSEIARDYINSGGNPAEVVTRTADFQGALSNNNAAEAAAAAQQLAAAEAQRIAAEQAAAAVAAEAAAAAKAADDKAKAEAQRLAQEAAERAARAAANAAAAATAMTAINATVPGGTPETGTGAPAIAAPTPTAAAAGVNCGSSPHNACSPNADDGNWYKCVNGSWQKDDACKPAGAITCVLPMCAGANGCIDEGIPAMYNGVAKICQVGRWENQGTIRPVIPQDPNPEEAIETWMATEDGGLANRGLPRPTATSPTIAVAPPTSAPIPTQRLKDDAAMFPTTAPTTNISPIQRTAEQEQVLEKFHCGERGGTWINNTCQSPGRPSPTIVPNPTASAADPSKPTPLPTAAPIPPVTDPSDEGSRYRDLKIPTPLPTKRPAGQAGLPEGYRCSESGGELIDGECVTGVKAKTETLWAGGGTFGRTVKVTTKTFCSGNSAVTQTSRSDGVESSDSTACEWGCDGGACRPPTIQETAVVRMDVINNAIDQAKVRCQRSGKTNCDTAAVYQDAMQNVDAREPSQVQAEIIRNTASQLSTGDKKALIDQEYQNLYQQARISQQNSLGSGGWGSGLFGDTDLTDAEKANLRRRAAENVDRILASGNIDAGGGNILDANSSDWDQIGGVSGDRAQEIIDQQKGIKGKFIAKAIFCSTNDEFQQQHLLDCGGLQLLDQDFLRSAWSGLIAGKSDDPIWTQGMKFGDARSAKYQVREYNDKVAPECGVYVAQRELTAEETDCLTGQTVAALYKWDTVDEQNQVNAALNVTSAALGFAGGAVGAGIKATSLVGKATTVVLRSGVVPDLVLVPAFAETMTAGDRAEADALTALAQADGISDDQRAMRQARAETAQTSVDTAYTENVISSIVAVTAMNLGGEALGSVARRAIGDSPIGRLLLGNLPPAARQGAAQEVANALNNEVIAPASLFPGQVNRRVVSAEEVLAGINKVKTDLSGNTAEALAKPGVVAGADVPVGKEASDVIAAARTASRQNSGFIAEVKQGVGQIVSEGEIAITDVGRTLEKGVDNLVNNAARTASSVAQTAGEAFDAARINLTGKGKIPVEAPDGKLFSGETAAVDISGPGQTARTVVFDPSDRTFPFRETPDLGGQPVKDIQPGVIVESGDAAYILGNDGAWRRYSDTDVVGGGGEGIIPEPETVEIPTLSKGELIDIYFPPGIDGPIATGKDIDQVLGLPRSPDAPPMFAGITADDLADDAKALDLLRKVFKLADSRRIGFEGEKYGSVFVNDGLLEEMLTRKGLSASYDAVNAARREYVSEMFEKPARDLLYVDFMNIAKKLKEHPNPEVQKRAEVVSALLHYWLNESKIAADGQFVDYIYSRVTRNTQEEFYWTQPFGTKFPPKVNTRTLAEALIDNGLIDFDNQRVFDVLQQYLNFESTFSTETRFDGSWRKASAVLIRENRGLDRALIHAGEIADSGQPVTLDSIREIQYLLTRNLKKDAGHLRAIDVNIGDVPFEQVRPKLVKWVDALNKSMEAAARGDLNNEALYLEAARLHYELTIIHPFTDGNGRVVRIVSNLVLEKGNKPLFYIPVENKSEYLNYLRTLDKLDPSSPEFTRKMDDFASFLRENSNFSSFEEIASETVTPSLREDIDSYGVVQVPPKTEMENLGFGGGDGGEGKSESLGRDLFGFEWQGFRDEKGNWQFPIGRPKPADVEVPVKPGSEGVGGGEGFGEKIGGAVSGVREKILPSKLIVSEPEWNEKTIGIDEFQTEVDNLLRQAKDQGMPSGTKITISYFDDDLKLKTINTKLKSLATAIRSVLENNRFGTSFGELSIKFGNSGIELGSVSNLSDPQNIVWNVRDIPTKAELNYLITHSADFRKKIALARDIGVIGFSGAMGAALAVTGFEISMYYFYLKPTTDRVPLKDPEAALRDVHNLPPNDFRCVGNQIVEVSATTGEVLQTLETCQSGCSSGMCQAREDAACRPGEHLRVSDSSESCSLSCVDGVYAKDFAQCDSIDLNGISTNRYREVTMRTLSILPDDFFPVEKFDKLSIYEVPLAYFSRGDIGDFSPEVNWRDQETELHGMASQSGEHLLIGRESLSEGLVSGVSGTLIHELLHLWVYQSVKPLPEGVPYSLVASLPAELLSGGAPFGYPPVTGCLDGGAGSPFHDQPVDGRAINCGEDFAYAGTKYVLEACQLKSYSPERYEYFKNEVFQGKEYIPESGCPSQGG